MENNENKLEKPTAELTNWYVFYGSLYGIVHNSEKFADGSRIVTSTVVDVTRLSDRFIVETLNTMYTCKFDSVAAKVEDTIDELHAKLKDIIGNFRW